MRTRPPRDARSDRRQRSVWQGDQAVAPDVTIGHERDAIDHSLVSLALGADLSYGRGFGNALDGLPPR
jgi:hypothetical protein